MMINSFFRENETLVENATITLNCIPSIDVINLMNCSLKVKKNIFGNTIKKTYLCIKITLIIINNGKLYARPNM